jgi:hypothetical protein
VKRFLKGRFWKKGTFGSNLEGFTSMGSQIQSASHFFTPEAAAAEGGAGVMAGWLGAGDLSAQVAIPDGRSLKRSLRLKDQKDSSRSMIVSTPRRQRLWPQGLTYSGL